MNRPRLARVPHRLARLRPASPPHLLLSPRPLLLAVLTASILAGLSLCSLALATHLPPAARLIPAAHLTSATRRIAPGAAAGGYLHTDGVRLEDASGHEVRLTGLNWFGLETCAFGPHGLWARNWRSLMVQIRSLGFNTIRLPFSSQLLDPGSLRGADRHEQGGRIGRGPAGHNHADAAHGPIAKPYFLPI